jgi:hypothetical protein
MILAAFTVSPAATPPRASTRRGGELGYSDPEIVEITAYRACLLDYLVGQEERTRDFEPDRAPS